MAVGQDLRAVGGDERGPRRRRWGGDGLVERLVAAERASGAEELGIGTVLRLGAGQAGLNRVPVRGAAGQHLAQLSGALGLHRPQSGGGDGHLLQFRSQALVFQRHGRG